MIIIYEVDPFILTPKLALIILTGPDHLTLDNFVTWLLLRQAILALVILFVESL